MDRDAFRMLPPEKQVKHINDVLKTGIGLENACHSVGFARASIRERFQKSGYIFNKELQQYVQTDHKSNYQSEIASTKEYFSNNLKLQDSYESNLGEYEPSKSQGSDVITKHYKGNDDNHKDNDKVITELNSKVDELYSWYLKQETKEDFRPIPFEGDPINRTYKIYPDVLKEFTDFCQGHKQYKVQDIISHALKKFLNEYKNGNLK